MSSAADKARAKAERLGAQRAPAASPESGLPVMRAERVKPIRMTLDLAPALHAELEDWATAVSRRLGSKVMRADVLRVLVRELLDDEDLQREVTARLRSMG